ncbi:hypothetical protein [Sorangium sp. So ce381]|uniref:hypothetical protein n=1 Tax=Sorangium sp. So ce381 TaxID=3133307 RepID=UPI003F5B31A3
MPNETDARVWLRANGFSKLADAIDEIMRTWRERGLKTRRNWWEALAGTPKGAPMTVEGTVFPIIAAVRERRGLPPVDGAIELPPGVTVPEQVPQARWAKKRRRRTAKPKPKAE